MLTWVHAALYNATPSCSVLPQGASGPGTPFPGPPYVDGANVTLAAVTVANDTASSRWVPLPSPTPVQAASKQQQQQQQPQQPPNHSIRSTATTALGHHLATGTLYGTGSHGSIPSNTSRYTSADVGLIHMVGLDLNKLDPVQLAWLEADLARANEDRYPPTHTQHIRHTPHKLHYATGVLVSLSRRPC